MLVFHSTKRNGPGADGRAAEVLAHLLHGGGRDDARDVHGERAEDRAVGLPRRHVHREVVHHLGAGEGAGQARPARRRGAAQRAVEGELHRGRVERGAVVELDARPQLEAHLGRRHHLPRRRQRRPELHLLVDGQQRLEHVEVHPRAGGGGLELGIERHGVGGPHDGEGAAGLLRRRRRRGGETGRAGQGESEEEDKRGAGSSHG